MSRALARVAGILNITRSEQVVNAASEGLQPTSAEPSLAQAKANGVLLTALLTNYRTVNITRPGDYYFAGESTDYSAIKWPSTFRRLMIAPGVRLIRHSAYYGSTPGIGMLNAFAQYVTENEGARIDGGGTLARNKATVPNNDGMQTNEFCHANSVELHNITIETIGASSGGKYGILTTGINRVTLRNIHFKGAETANSHKSDGYHHTGRAGIIDIQGLTGATTDNMIGIGIDEGANYLASVPVGFQGGTLESVVVRNIHPTTTQAEPIRFFGWSTANLGLTGATYTDSTKTVTKTNGFASILHFKSAVAAGTITLTVALSGGSVSGTHTIASITDASNIVLVTDAGSDSAGTVAVGIVTNNAVMRNIHIDGLTGSVATAAQSGTGTAVTSGVGFAWDNGLTNGVIENVLIENVSIRGGEASGATANVIISGGGVQRVVIRNVRPQGDGSHGHTAVKIINTAVGLTHLTVESCYSSLPSSSTASAHLIGFENNANGGAMTLDELVLRNNTIKVNNTGNSSSLIATDTLAQGAVTVRRWVGQGNAYIGSAANAGTPYAIQWGNNAANVILDGHEDGFYLKNCYGLLDAGNASGSLRSRFHFNGLSIFAQTTNELVRGKVDVTSANLTATNAEIIPTGNASGNRTGAATWSHAPQWSAIQLTYADFVPCGAVSTANLNMNPLGVGHATVARYNNVLGQGYIVRGGNVQFGMLSHYNVQWAGTGLTTATISMGNIEDSAFTKYAAAYTVSGAPNGLSKTLTIVSAGNSIENVAASKDIGFQLIITAGGGTVNNLTAGVITGWLQWSFTCESD